MDRPGPQGKRQYSSNNMSEDRDAKKRKMNDGEKESPPALSDVLKLVGDMKREMSSMRKEMASMRREMNRMQIKVSSHDFLEGQITLLRNQLRRQSSYFSQCLELTKLSMLATEGIEAKVDDLEADIGTKLKFHRQLIENQSWTYSAPIPEVDSPVWLDDHEVEDEEERQNIVDLLERMKETSTTMRQCELLCGGFDVSVVSFIDYMYWDGSYEVLYWNDVMLGHWKEFCQALSAYRHFMEQHQHFRSDQLKFSVSLRGLQLPPNVFTMLAKALKGMRFKRLDLECMDSGKHLISFAANVLKSDEGCQELCLDGNCFEKNDASNDALWAAIGKDRKSVV